MDAPSALALVLQALGIVAGVGAAGALAWARMNGRIDSVAKDTDVEIAALHARINEVRNDYVRRDDWKEALHRIEEAQRDAAQSIARLAEAQHATAKVVTAIAMKLDVPHTAGE